MTETILRTQDWPAPAPAAAGGYPVTIALQGGGAHGAFEWGVLDRLLDAPGLHIGTVSGTSAGAMNAAMLVQGLATGGPEQARRLLDWFWRCVAATSGSTHPDLAPWPWSLPGLLEALRRTHQLAAPLGSIFGLNPLRAILRELLDPSVFGQPGVPTLVISATRVRTGEARLFRDAEVTVDALLASACLPQLFPGVEIEGEVYWDGGYSSNPPLRPLIEAGSPPDIILVRTTPLERPEAPRNAGEIEVRAAELGFGAGLRQELRSVAIAQAMLADLPGLPPSLARLRDARLHMIGAEEAFRELSGRRRLDPNWSFLRGLHRLGVETADEWLEANQDRIGACSTVDLWPFAEPVLRPSMAEAQAVTANS